MTLRFWLKRLKHQPRLRWSLVKTYRAISSAPVDTIWRKITDVADVSWHPLIAKTNVPYGLVAKPGLIYRAVSRVFPMSFQVFVERVKPNQLISVRVFAWPGLEERVTYQIESDVTGTFISYSVMLRGWLAPLAWSFLRGSAETMAERLAKAAETDGIQTIRGYWRSRWNCFDF